MENGILTTTTVINIKNEVPIPFPLEFHKNVKLIVVEIESQNIITFRSIDEKFQLADFKK